MKNLYLVLYILLLTFSAGAQQFELIGSPGANGNVINIAVDPDNPSVVYSSHLQGLFKSEDRGQTVKALSTVFSNIYTNDIQAFNNGTIIFGDYSSGYHKSSDGGDNWTIINEDQYSKKVIRINPLNHEQYYIKKNYNEIWRSNNGGDSWYKFASFNEEVISFDIFPGDTSLLYVATHSQLFKTTNAGQEWVKISDLPGTDAMSMNPLNSNTLYFRFGGRLQKSVDGGENIFPIIQSQVQTYKLSTADTSVIYASIQMDDVGVKRGNYKSTDGGLTWNELKIGLEFSSNPTQVASTIEINPRNADEVYVGIGYRGVFKTTDGGANWFHTNLTNMETYCLAADENNPDDVVMENLGWGILKTTDGGKNWFYPSFDLAPSTIPWTERCFDFNPLNKKEGYLAGSNYLYKTTDGGSNWSALTDMNYVNYGIVFFHKYSPNIIFLLANYGPYLSTDNGITWARSEGGRTSNHIRFVKTDINVLYDYDLVHVIYDSYKFIAKKSTDLGKSWVEINNGLLRSSEVDKNLDITALEPDINNPDVVYCGQKGGLSKSTNGGGNWFRVDSSLKVSEPWLNVTSVMLDQIKSERLYAGLRAGGTSLADKFTKAGLYLTEDDCKTWRKVFTGSVLGLYSDDGNPRHIFINTYQGVFRFLDTLTVTDIKDVRNNLPESFLLQQNYPNPFNPTTSISYSIKEMGLVTLKIFDVLGREVSVLVNEVKEPGKYNINFDASKLSSGVYIYLLNAGSFTSSKKMILTK